MNISAMIMIENTPIQSILVGKMEICCRNVHCYLFWIYGLDIVIGVTVLLVFRK